MAKQPAKGRKSSARGTNAKQKAADSAEIDPIEDAVEVVSETASDEKIGANNSESPVEAEGDSVVVTDPQLASEGEPEPAVQKTLPEIEPSEPAPTPTPSPQSNSVFVPMILGGFCAGLIGYGVAYLQYGNDTGIADTDIARIATLEDQVANIPLPVEPTPFDASGIEAQIVTVSDDVGAVADSIAGLDERVAVLERQPSGDGTLQETAIAAYQADIDALRAQIETQQDELRAIAEAATNQLDATRAEALSIEQNAIDAARAATGRAALARVQAALESGAPIGAVLAELGDTIDAPVPDALTAVTDGAPTLAALQDAFPDAARAALSTARSEGADGEGTGGIGAFFRNQFDVRSVTPREGDSVDAILSRAEAALRTGRLSDTLAEIATLPEVSRAALSDWTANAELRAAALDAADTLATSLNDN